MGERERERERLRGPTASSPTATAGLSGWAREKGVSKSMRGEGPPQAKFWKGYAAPNSARTAPYLTPTLRGPQPQKRGPYAFDPGIHLAMEGSSRGAGQERDRGSWGTHLRASIGPKKPACLPPL